ncbi:hypothetical protein RRF57_011904 [Xylaria bambusicola]|uniref:Uncharacterized protein n=1 Tax=Xylaria bambusicola TaxID=326684 RepID=A0AAN7UUE3_9PEZI
MSSKYSRQDVQKKWPQLFVVKISAGLGCSQPSHLDSKLVPEPTARDSSSWRAILFHENGF